MLQDSTGKTHWSYLVEMARTSLTTDSSSRQCSTAYGYSFAKVARVPQHWNYETPTIQTGSRARRFLDCFYCWNVNSVARTLKQMSRWSRKPGQSLNGFRRSLKPPLKMGKKMETCFAANRQYFEKENVRCTASECEDDMSE